MRKRPTTANVSESAATMKRPATVIGPGAAFAKHHQLLHICHKPATVSQSCDDEHIDARERACAARIVEIKQRAKIDGTEFSHDASDVAFAQRELTYTQSMCPQNEETRI